MAVTQNAPRLIVSFDFGTTKSIVAVAYLTPGQTPFVSAVDRWPGQEEVPYEAKVPTAVLYDDQGALIACGAEAVNVDMTNRMASQPAWNQPEHFKMQLHPGNTLSRDDRTRRNPDAVPLSRVYADYLAHLLKHTRSYLADAFGYDMWLEFEGRVEIALSHPNCRGAREQGFLQNAAVQAGLITNNGAAQRLHFVEEIEVLACFAIQQNLFLSAELEAGAKFVICNAGGSTIDISSYCVNRRVGLSIDVEELELPSCLGNHVDKEFVMHLYEQLYTEDDFQDDDTDYLHNIVNDARKDFQNYGMRKFSSPSDSLSVRLGGRRMNYPRINLTRGAMHIASPTPETFFKPSVEQAVETVYGLAERHGIRIIILTGGFSQSPYFKFMIENHSGSEGKTVIWANDTVDNTVAIGALRLIAGRDGSMTVKRKKRP